MREEKLYNASKDATQSIKKNVILQSLQLEDIVSFDNIEQNECSDILKDYLNAPLGSDKDAQIKKIMATAISLAQQNDCLPFDIPSTEPEDIAKLVDEGLNRTKVAYQVGTGAIDTIEAVDMLIDAATARVVATVNYAFKSGAVNRVLTLSAVGLLTYLKVPNAQSYGPLISNVIKRVEQPIQNFINKGINHITQTAKSAVRKVASSIKEFVNRKVLAIS